MAKTFSLHFTVDFSLDIVTLSQQNRRIPRILFTHDECLFHKNIGQKKNMKFHTKRYKHKKVVFLGRDPRDLIVSYFHQVTDREKKIDMDISSFVRHDVLGIDHMIQFYNLWAENRDVPRAFLCISYEELHRDAFSVLREVCNYVGLEEIPDSTLREAVAFSQFDRLQKMEKEKRIPDGRIRAKSGGGANALKVRKGKVGGFADELLREDVTYVNESMKQLDPFFRHST